MGKFWKQEEVLQVVEGFRKGMREDIEGAGTIPATSYIFCGVSPDTGKEEKSLIPYPPLADEFNSPEGKAFYAFKLRILCRQLKAEAFVQVSEAWMLKLKTGDNPDEVLRKYREAKMRYGSMEKVPGVASVAYTFVAFLGSDLEHIWRAKVISSGTTKSKKTLEEWTTDTAPRNKQALFSGILPQVN